MGDTADKSAGSKRSNKESSTAFQTFLFDFYPAPFCSHHTGKGVPDSEKDKGGCRNEFTEEKKDNCTGDKEIGTAIKAAYFCRPQ